jgi:hypothetical protein
MADDRTRDDGDGTMNGEDGGGIFLGLRGIDMYANLEHVAQDGDEKSIEKGLLRL